MKILIIVANPSSLSFTRALRLAVAEGVKCSQIEVRDLYEINFNPVLSDKELKDSYKLKYVPEVLVEHRYISDADMIVWIYPLWWGSMPAIMRGYLDRVLSYGFAYKSIDGKSVGLLYNKRNVIINTIGSTSELYTGNGMINAIETIANPGIFNFCGTSVEKFFHFASIHTVGDEQRENYLAEVRDYFASIE